MHFNIEKIEGERRKKKKEKKSYLTSEEEETCRNHLFSSSRSKRQKDKSSRKSSGFFKKEEEEEEEEEREREREREREKKRERRAAMATMWAVREARALLAKTGGNELLKQLLVLRGSVHTTTKQVGKRFLSASSQETKKGIPYDKLTIGKYLSERNNSQEHKMG